MRGCVADMDMDTGGVYMVAWWSWLVGDGKGIVHLEMGGVQSLGCTG